ncbi:Glu/Leu/Phe/Val family dehydrogenase, partial [Xylanivirga thermophila]|uniref:Glu/Leu/Phe/Val family dehydrogenase n=1 Tax=Xylanivirga thermophila TaxID=2496273 RepID=UPI0039F5439A
ARLLYQAGCKVIGVSDVSGGIYNPDGLDMDKISDFTQSGHLLEDYDQPGLKHIDNFELLTCDTDILIPAALENQITEDVAKEIKTQIIVEGANGPTTVAADKILDEKGIYVVPDILANAGGVVVSYFEWVQNLQRMAWDIDVVNAKLETIMKNAFEDVWQAANEKNTTMRMGAYMVAIGRLVKAKKIRGIFP